MSDTIELMDLRRDRAKIRELLVSARPEWRGKIWIYRCGITVRGVTSAFYFIGPRSRKMHEPAAIVQQFIEEFDRSRNRADA